MQMTTGTRIKQRRAALRLKQKDVAEFIGCSVVAVGRWENDEYEPTGTRLLLLSQILETTPGHILDGTDPDEGMAAENMDIKNSALDILKAASAMGLQATPEDLASMIAKRHAMGASAAFSDWIDIIENHNKS